MSAFVLSTPFPSNRRTSLPLSSNPFLHPLIPTPNRPYSQRKHSSPLMQTTDSLSIMVNGLPGRMAAATAEQVLHRGLHLIDHALTGPNVSSLHHRPSAHPSKSITLHLPEHHATCLQHVCEQHPRLIVVDYTHPSAANRNVELYAAHGLSFVIGTTGGNAQAMRDIVSQHDDVYAVIAPNMGKQIVAFQAMMEMMAQAFPSAFAGYTMHVKESHQVSKADTSGTAKSVVASFQKLGLPFEVDQIERVRDGTRAVQEMDVPEEFVEKGHAFHTYHLTSPDGSVHFEFQHNVCGRTTYAAGTVDAVQFLDAQRAKGGQKRVFDMIDILRSGDMS